MSALYVLAMDTTAAHGSLALADRGELIEQVEIVSPDGFGHVIFGEIESLLSRHGLRVADTGLFAAASGPGSFTGVRVGLSAAKGLAAALGRPACGVSNLEALASMGEGPLRAAVIDARRGEVYAGLYSGEGQALQPECVTPFETWKERLPEGTVFVTAEALPFVPTPRVIAGRASAAAIARIAWKRYAQTGPEALEPAALDANYVRKSDAELFWVDR